MTYRIDLEYLASGQPRPYADSRSHVRITFTYFFAWLGDPKDARSEWRPRDHFTEEEVKAILLTLKCGFPTKPNEESDWAAPKLQYLKKTAPGVWEFYTTSAYTD